MVRVLRARSRVVVCTRQAKSEYVFPFDALSFYLARARIYLISARDQLCVTRKRRKRQCNDQPGR